MAGKADTSACENDRSLPRQGGEMLHCLVTAQEEEEDTGPGFSAWRATSDKPFGCSWLCAKQG